MGEVFAGRYELVDPIGRGGVGAVWRAWDHRRRRYVAAKVLQQSDAHTLLRFVREQALRIDHPHVLAPASWAADDDKVLFTMELVCGGSLAHLIGDYGPLPHGYVCTLLDQLLAGLAAVHAEGVVHRDIKPANVLLEATGVGRPHLRLSDFGIAMRKGEPRLTDTNYVVGTPGYFAPEQAMGAEPDFPADLFAVGLVALYLIQGAKPDAKALVEHFATHGTPSAPKNIPEPLWQVIANLLQPDPQARFRTATGARKALVSAAEMLPQPGPDDELVEVFDQIGPLPAGFGPTGPLGSPPRSGPDVVPRQASAMSETGSFHLPPPSGGVPHQPGPAPVSSQSPGPVPPAAQPHGPASNSPWTPGASQAGSGASGFQPSGPPSHGGPVSGSSAGANATPRPEAAGPPIPGPAQSGHSYPSDPPRHTPHSSSFLQQPAAPPLPASAPPGHEAAAPVPPHSFHSPHTSASSTPPGQQHSPAQPPAHPPEASRAHHPPDPSYPGLSHARTAAVPLGNAPTRPYTAERPQAPPSAYETPVHTAAAGSPASHAPVSHTTETSRAVTSHAARPRKKPGPPRIVTVPVLLLALLCFAVGFWALSQS